MEVKHLSLTQEWRQYVCKQVLRGICESVREAVVGDYRTLPRASFTILLFTKYYSGKQIKDDNTDDMQRTEGKCILGFGEKT